MAKSFKSYINHSVDSTKGKSRETFKSYVEGFDDTWEEEEEEEESQEDLQNNASQFFTSDFAPNLLPGERCIAEAQHVLQFTPFSERKQGISGSLFITNFKVSFVTADKSSYNETGKRQRNQLINENEIPLTCIDSLYQVVSGGKKKQLSPFSTVSSPTKFLEIICKDFRICTFGFKFTPKDQIKQITNTLIHHAFPTKSDLLFALDYSRALPFDGPHTRSETPLFDNPHDWEYELRRLRATSWHLTDINKNFSTCFSLPEYFVVPGTLMNNDLNRAAPQFVDDRVLTWCYTHVNGISLVSMAYLRPETGQPQFEQKILESIQSSNRTKRDPVQMDLGKLCPSVRDIQQSFEKLKDICITDNKKDFLLQDLNWYTVLEGTKWLQLVAQCLKTAVDAVEKIVKKERTVILRESDSRNLACLVSSLTQILLDPHFRTLKGFQSLIQREWVQKGHPFKTNASLIKQSETEQCPVFLLFLDCVWQLLQQFPSCFAFTETYLTSLWDCVHIGLFETFLFDSRRAKSLFLADSSSVNQEEKYRLPVVWNWKLQFCEEDMSFFNNPMYIMLNDPQLNVAISSAKEILKCDVSKQTRTTQYEKRLGSMYSDDGDIFSVYAKTHVLWPVTMVPVMRLWSQCYLRWMGPAQIVGGGNPSQYLQQCLMVDEVLHLQHRVKSLQENQTTLRPKSELIFGMAMDMPHTPDLLQSSYITSSFPFSPGPRSQHQQMLFLTPISAFLQSSFIENDYTNLED